MQKKKWIDRLVLFLFCFAILFGPAFNYDFIASPDLANYLGMAEFDFDQSPVRKYRVIIPFLAAAVNFVLGPLFTVIAPNTFPGPDFAMGMSFFLVNVAITSIAGVMVYYLCRSFGASRQASFVGLLSVLTCRWTFYIAGLPYVDSLYLLVICMTILGIKTKNTLLISLAIFIGPWSKESFIFIAPIIFFFSHISKGKQVVLFLISAALVAAFRFALEGFNCEAFLEGLQHDVNHVDNIVTSLTRLFSFHGVYEIFSVFGFWGLLFLFLFAKRIRQTVLQKTPIYFYLFLIVVMIHALLSTDLARMFYLAAPVLAVWFAIIIDEIPYLRQGEKL